MRFRTQCRSHQPIVGGIQASEIACSVISQLSIHSKAQIDMITAPPLQYTSIVQMKPFRFIKRKLMARIPRSGIVPTGTPMHQRMKHTHIKDKVRNDSISHFFVMSPLAIIEKARSRKKNGSNRSTSGVDDC